jgi:hypothetical protein
MKPRFKKDDTVTVNGQQMTIIYWPEDNQNFFRASAVARDGGREEFTYHVTQLVETEQPISDADVEAVTNRGKRKA